MTRCISRAALAAIAVVSFSIAATAHEGERTQAPAASRVPWDPEIVELFASLPVQDEGRIKPMDTFAAFKLLKINGMRATRDLDGNRLTPMEWMLDALFYPELARQYKTFIVTTWEAPEAIGISIEGKKKRDRYSYNELELGQEKLIQLATEYSKKEAKDRTAREQEIVNIANNVLEFQFIMHNLDYARERVVGELTPGLSTLMKDTDVSRFSNVLVKLPLLKEAYRTLSSGSPNFDATKAQEEKATLEHLITDIHHYATRASGIAMFPPSDVFADTKSYVTPLEVLNTSFELEKTPQQQIDWIAAMERLVSLRDDRPAFQAELEKLHGQITGVATARGEYAKIPLEVFFYKSKVLFWSAWTFVLSFLLITVYWVKPRLAAAPDWSTISGMRKLALKTGRAVYRAIPLTVLIPTVLLIAGITMRCIIRSRPPVSTLYETILFITACAVLMALFIEYINRQRIALSLAAMLGSLGMFLANKYEAKEGIDTMPSLQAVLDTNFWLSTHVTTVTMGYGAGLFAAAIAHVYIFGRLFGFKRNEPAFYKTLYKMTYGVICFGLLFSVLGTVLGGIWANDSWGRFWGWDPKENGALLICLWMLVMLHGRMGGYIRDLGFAITSVLCGMVVAFSWWGVNLLSVGLHSYGFTAGIFQYLMAFYGFELFVVLCGVAVWLSERLTTAKPALDKQPADTPLHPKKLKTKKSQA